MANPLVYSDFPKFAFKKCQYVEIYVTLKQKIICAPFVKYRKSPCIRREFDPKFVIHSLGVGLYNEHQRLKNKTTGELETNTATKKRIHLFLRRLKTKSSGVEQF